MIDHGSDLEFETNEDGDMLDPHDLATVWCDSEACGAPAQHRVVVSEEGPHDSTRDYCCGCYEIYLVGVQHGRYHEAALHGTVPGRDSSQEPPVLRENTIPDVDQLITALDNLASLCEARGLYPINCQDARDAIRAAEKKRSLRPKETP